MTSHMGSDSIKWFATHRRRVAGLAELCSIFISTVLDDKSKVPFCCAVRRPRECWCRQEEWQEGTFRGGDGCDCAGCHQMGSHDRRNAVRPPALCNDVHSGGLLGLDLCSRVDPLLRRLCEAGWVCVEVGAAVAVGGKLLLGKLLCEDCRAVLW